MVNGFLRKHVRIIGMPILHVNRDTDTFYRHTCCMEGLGTRLRYARKVRKMTQKVLAAASGVRQPSISDLETGETKEISGPTLLALSKALRVRAWWLGANRGPMELTGSDLEIKEDERMLIEKYREAAPTWRAAIQNIAALPPDQQDWVMENVLERVFRASEPNNSVTPPSD